MGLDVYLFTAQEAKQNEQYDREEQAAHDAEDESLLTTSYAPPQVVPSANYPDHLFGRRYLRSSYNEGGFDNVVPQLAGRDVSLDALFAPVRGEDDRNFWLRTEHAEGLRQIRQDALALADELRAADGLKTTAVDLLRVRARTTREQALAWYREAVEKTKDSTVLAGSWEDQTGVYYGDEGLTVLAAVPGTEFGQIPVVHLVYRSSDESREWYAQAAEIVAEFCDEALGLVLRDGSCYVVWSG